MAVDLAAEVKNRKIANALTNGDDETDSETDEPETPDSTDETDSDKETAAPSEPAAASAATGKVSTFADDVVASVSPTPAPSAADRIGPFTHAIAEDQPVADYVPAPSAELRSVPATAQPVQPEAVAAQPETVPEGHIDLGPPGRNIYTASDTGARYVIDPDTGQMVPHAELATAADKAAQPPGTELPRVEVGGADIREEGLPVPQDQVRRAQLVKLPAAVQPAPDRLDQVERGELVKLPTQPAPDTLSQVEKGIALPPKVQPAQPVTGATQPVVRPPAQQQAPVQPVPGKVQTFADDLSPKPAAAAQQPAAPGQVPAEPQIDIQSQSYTKGRTQEPTKLILHSTDGSSEKADVNTLTGAEPVSVNYYVTKDGRVMHFVSEGDTAWHAGADRFGGNGNAYTLGIEQQHVDGKEPWPDAQVRATAGVAAGILARHPNMTIDDVIGHSDLAGERKQDPVDYPWAKFRKYVAEAQGQQGSGQPAVQQGTAAPSAQPVTKLKTGFYQDEKPSDFLNGRVTTFATPEDIASGQDNGVGAPKLGQLDTTRVAGVAIPEPVLQQMFGRDWAAAARQARVDVVDPTTGKRLRVPIVDLGPSTDAISDMTPALAGYFGGDKNLSIKIVPKAGPDVMKNPQLFYDEQAAIKNGFDSSTLDAKRQVIAPAGSRFTSVAQTPEEAAAAQKSLQAAIQKQQDTLSALQAKSTNMPDWYQTLQSPIPGVSDAMRKAVADNYKQEITKYAQDYYKEPDPDKAFARIMSAPNLLTSAGEIWTKAGANFQHAWLSIAQQADSPTQTKLIDFVNAVQPDATPEARTALINQVMSKTGRDRVDFVNHLYNAAQVTHPDTVQNVNMYSLLDAIDVSAQPGMQAKEAANHARVAAAVAQNVKDLREDPTMENTYGGTISNAIAQMPKNVLEAITPVIGQSAMFSEIYTDTVAGLRKDHPDWSDDQIKAKAAAASLPQDVLQELVNAATLGMGSGLTKGITNPIARIAANAIMHGGIAATAGTAQQALANVQTGRPAGEGVAQAGLAAGIQGLIGGAISGRHPTEAAPEERVVQSPPVEPPRAAVEPPLRPVTARDILSPEASQPPPVEQQPPVEQVLHPDNDVRVEKSPLGDWAVYLYGKGGKRGGASFATQELAQAAAESMRQSATGHYIDPGDWNAAFNRARDSGQSVNEAFDTANRTVFNPIERKPAQQPPPAIPEVSAQMPWYEPGPIVTRAGERETFTPAELAAGVSGMRAGGTPEEMRQAAENLQPAADFRNRGVFLGDVGQVEIDQALAAQARQNLYPIDRQGQPKVSESEPWVSQMANRFTAERMASGELGPVEPGVGVTKEEMLARGLKMPPETIAQHVSNVMNDVGGNPRDQAAAIRTEEARLSQRSHNASLLSEADPNNAQLRIDADNAFKDLTDFHNGPVAKLKNNWHAQGMTLQGEIPVDLSSYNGLRDAYLRDVGKPPPPSAEPAMRAAAKRVRDAADAESAAMRNLGAEIERQSARRRLPSDEEVRNKIMARMKVEPCAI